MNPLPSPRTCVAALAILLGGCLSPSDYREQADDVVAKIIDDKQQEAFGENEPFTIERPSDTLRRLLLIGQELPNSGPASFGTDQLEVPENWPEEFDGPQPIEPPPWGVDDVLLLTLDDCLQIGARNSREYQTTKEDVFLSALRLDLERDQFRNTFFGAIDTTYSTDLGPDDSVNGIVNTDSATLTRRFKNGATLMSNVFLDIVQILRGDHSEALGIFADATVSIPLLRGAGEDVVTEPLRQAERNIIYALHDFERFKRVFAVRVATDYLNVLQLFDQLRNAEDNYRRLIFLARQSARLGEAGRIQEFQVDQAKQDELRSRDRWISARASYQRRLDQFKITLGIPTDARIELDRAELAALSTRAEEALGEIIEQQLEEYGADVPIDILPPSREVVGPMELEPQEAILIALENRLDLRNAVGQVFDSQRKVAVAANGLEAGVDVVLSGAMGERRGISTAGLSNAELRPEKGFYSAGLLVDLPWERTAERNIYRQSLIDLEVSSRAVQALEDQIKQDMRDGVRVLTQTRESYLIQKRATELAVRRVESTNMLLEAGRTQIRDLLEAQEALISAQNSLSSALVNYRVAELEIQRDMGVLIVDETGLWQEYTPHASP